MRISRDSDSDPCPVTDDLLGELYRANKNGLPELIATVSPDVRAALAMYCYRRGHLKGIGLAIASTCDIYDLETVGGTAGAALFARSREVAPAAPVASQYVARQKITLASGSLRKSLPIDEDVELDDIDLDDTPEGPAGVQRCSAVSLRRWSRDRRVERRSPHRPARAGGPSAWNFLFAANPTTG